jgi:hypothetical protein
VRVEFDANSALHRISRKAFMRCPIVALTLSERSVGQRGDDLPAGASERSAGSADMVKGIEAPQRPEGVALEEPQRVRVGHGAAGTEEADVKASHKVGIRLEERPLRPDLVKVDPRWTLIGFNEKIQTVAINLRSPAAF